MSNLKNIYNKLLLRQPATMAIYSGLIQLAYFVVFQHNFNSIIMHQRSQFHRMIALYFLYLYSSPFLSVRLCASLFGCKTRCESIVYLIIPHSMYGVVLLHVLDCVTMDSYCCVFSCLNPIPCI